MPVMQLKLQGNALAQQGKFADARELYKQALEVSPTHMVYKLHSNLSLVALSADDPTEAIAQAQQALECAPEDFTTVRPVPLGLLLHALGRLTVEWTEWMFRVLQKNHFIACCRPR